MQTNIYKTTALCRDMMDTVHPYKEGVIVRK